ncbi:SHOCT domain-containing protein [Natronococcus jeotgali]|uniref:SHOCT domain-containing protein n=1 Tax=Natronococcus jeotgali DSM 18795 TaxID=1227498 RepID=L9X6X8_9EURY|nr:SHOCT domain-containing protein [Natronococcus jeotgali]ELY57357.1 hypothetical protein C492_13616 [Natronococcus jeotgali DSM 18795]
MVSRRWLYFGGFLIAGLLLIGTALLGLADAMSVLSDGTYYGEEFVVLAMLGEAVEWVLLGLVLGLVAVGFLAATVVSILRSASVPRDDRLAAVVERLERRYPLLARFDASNRVEPTAEDRRRKLKERYVAGELSDDEFERELERLADGDASSRRRSGTALEREDES